MSTPDEKKVCRERLQALFTTKEREVPANITRERRQA